MSVSTLFGDIEKAGIKVGDFLASIVTGAKKLQAAYATLSGPTLAAATAVFIDVVKAVSAATAAAGAAEAGNFSGAITLSENTVVLVQSVIADGKAGVKTIEADLAALGIKL